MISHNDMSRHSVLSLPYQFVHQRPFAWWTLAVIIIVLQKLVKERRQAQVFHRFASLFLASTREGHIRQLRKGERRRLRSQSIIEHVKSAALFALLLN